ncbi:hypothetical protein [uncultured Tenacibaculum sp.]|uniref:hypothetical protein n=1 Tax=uncultured Tenacibaculum sp. TaxID=174713 RepID=UPI00260B65DC|nr:hypothetical protein [uncultured Tenacibaculum sp.]
MLHRRLKDGKEFNDLMPSSDCSNVQLANGNTKVAIDKMAFWAKKYQHHTKELTSKKFSNLSLSKLCEKTHSFLFSHLQYKIDSYDQLLRSPACSWKSREEGLDCKSYSIFASTILLNAGIKHYLRRVIINEGEGYSHVYVTVPKNQKTGNLKEGYYVIDGTINTLKEQRVFKSDDVLMLPEKHTQLGFVQNGLSNGFNKLVSAGVDSFIEHLNSCSDSRFDKGIVELRIKRDLQKVLQNKITLLDEAIQISNRTRIERLFNELLKEVDLGIAHLRSETAHNTYDECALEVLQSALVFAEQLKKYIDSYFNNFKKTQTRFIIDVTTNNTVTSERTYYFVVGQSDNPILAEYRQISIRKEPNSYGVEPVVSYGEDINTWLISVRRHFITNYNDGRETRYEQKIRPVLVQIQALRKKVELGGEMLYYYEKPFHRELYQIFIEFDTKYAGKVKQEYKNLYLENQKSIKIYEERLQQDIEENRKAKRRKLLKKQFGYGALIVSALYLILKK